MPKIRVIVYTSKYIDQSAIRILNCYTNKYTGPNTSPDPSVLLIGNPVPFATNLYQNFGQNPLS
jgi:hypothetical protein